LHDKEPGDLQRLLRVSEKSTILNNDFSMCFFFNDFQINNVTYNTEPNDLAKMDEKDVGAQFNFVFSCILITAGLSQTNFALHAMFINGTYERLETNFRSQPFCFLIKMKLVSTSIEKNKMVAI
jgi:hypothetical protein